jgi:hypothetical protein
MSAMQAMQLGTVMSVRTRSHCPRSSSSSHSSSPWRWLTQCLQASYSAQMGLAPEWANEFYFKKGHPLNKNMSQWYAPTHVI